MKPIVWTEKLRWNQWWLLWCYMHFQNESNDGMHMIYSLYISEQKVMQRNLLQKCPWVAISTPLRPLDLPGLSPQISFSPLIIQCLAGHRVETMLHTLINTKKTCLQKTNAFCFSFWSSFNNVLEPPFSNVWGSAGKQDIHQIDRQNKLQGKRNLNVSPELMVSRLVGSRPRHSHAAAVTLTWPCSSTHKMSNWRGYRDTSPSVWDSGINTLHTINNASNLDS